MYSAVPADNRVKLNGSQQRNKHLDLARELKKKSKQTGEHEINFETVGVSFVKLGGYESALICVKVMS